MWVWVTSPLPSPTIWPTSFSLCKTKSTRSLFSLAVSAESRSQNDCPTGDGPAIFTPFKFDAKHQSSSLGLPPGLPGPQRPLSGSDVLRALKRATARKSKNKKNHISRIPKAGNTQDKAAAKHVDVRPLTIKTEWSVRLDQLQKRLEQLADS